MNHQGRDRKIFEKLIGSLNSKYTSGKDPGRLMLDIGRLFMEAPYREQILSREVERLVINLREQDCVTFVENVIALTWQILSRGKSFRGFQGLVKKIRYRQGRLQGFASRLHYFSDWIYDNERKGFVRDVTEEIGGKPFRKVINFMTTHPGLYPPLKEAANRRRMDSIEKNISKRSMFFVPKKSLVRLEERILDGDIIAITTEREGLDVQHVGLAARVRGRIHLLHASRAEGKVAISPKTLYGYLMRSRACSGIMVARVFWFKL